MRMYASHLLERRSHHGLLLLVVGLSRGVMSPLEHLLFARLDLRARGNLPRVGGANAPRGDQALARVLRGLLLLLLLFRRV